MVAGMSGVSSVVLERRLQQVRVQYVALCQEMEVDITEQEMEELTEKLRRLWSPSPLVALPEFVCGARTSSHMLK